MELNHNINLHSSSLSIFPLQVTIIGGGEMNQTKTVNSQEEMNQLLEEVKLYNSENEIKKRIISL